MDPALAPEKIDASSAPTGGAEVRRLDAADPLADPALLRALRERYLVWDPFCAGERRVDLHPLILSPALHRAAVRAAEETAAAIDEVASLANTDPLERARYGFSTEVERLAAASWSAGSPTSFARVDLLLGEDSRWLACEVNADCPGGQNEAHGLPKLARAAGFTAGVDPTIVLDAMAARLAELAARPGPGQGAVGLIFATAYAEDLQVCALVKRALEALGVRARLGPPTAPRLDGDAAVMSGGAVAAIYRYFPTEYMEGQKNLEALAAAVERGAVRMFPGFDRVYAQSKLAFARAFAREGELSASARAAVREHLPETLDLAEVPAAELVAARMVWVIKRAMGRVGDQVFVGALFPDEVWQTIVLQTTELRAAGESWIAQRRIPQRRVPTPWGERYVTLGAYVLEGRFVGYFARLTEETHVSHDALCVPVFVADE